MKKLVLIALLALSQPVAACQALYDKGLGVLQIEMLKTSYEYGKPYDWGLTLAAIAWKESNAGRYLINLQDPSVGPYHVTVDKVVRYLEFEHTSFNYNRAAQIALANPELTAVLAINELEYWHKKRKRTWYETVISYNAGNDLSNPRGRAYARDIVRYVKIIKQCNWE